MQRINKIKKSLVYAKNLNKSGKHFDEFIETDTVYKQYFSCNVCVCMCVAAAWLSNYILIDPKKKILEWSTAEAACYRVIIAAILFLQSPIIEETHIETVYIIRKEFKTNENPGNGSIY